MGREIRYIVILPSFGEPEHIFTSTEQLFVWHVGNRISVG